jgi:hypothetical protein
MSKIYRFSADQTDVTLLAIANKLERCAHALINFANKLVRRTGGCVFLKINKKSWLIIW